MRTPARIALALVVFVSFACSGDDDDAAPVTTTTEATTTTEEATTTTAPAPESTLVARSEVDVIDVFDTPEGGEPAMQLDRRSETTGNLVFVVNEEAASADGRHEVQLPVRPNGSTGWVDASDVSLSVHDYRIEIELAAFELRVYKGDENLLTTPIGVGTQDTPTPGGTYYIKELLQPPTPTGPYGTYAYGLSGFSNVLESFGGGNGVIGIHGTNQPELIGTNVSHGCIRVENDVISELVEEVGLPLGVPVQILE
ncbi:L,D-transpeptidase [Actinospongicola halichondriae]|uniref:L,D-transpeptidase n=1 Tax=Actinospongicola halichondriae TaxID=3236844 RepID=UPI003D5595C1